MSDLGDLFAEWAEESEDWARISAGVSALWAEDWDSPEDAVWDADMSDSGAITGR